MGRDRTSNGVAPINSIKNSDFLNVKLAVGFGLLMKTTRTIANSWTMNPPDEPTDDFPKNFMKLQNKLVLMDKTENSLPIKTAIHLDPSWDFYLVWHSCNYCKALIDDALQIVTSSEFPDPELYKKAQTLVREAEAILHEQFR
ncbi:hypothetical protein [[Scytonema hofmanni] UTEX B 1581]|nr:hypothetical protein [[Scytonema hofmanni] UTEX B 1581]